MSKEELNSIFQRIVDLQARNSDLFPDGIFPSWRSNSYWSYKRADSNVFATASVLFILNGLINYLPKSQTEELNKLNAHATKAFQKYANMHGSITYNFWQTKPSQHFPNGKLFRHFKHFKLPDDIDDTALIFLAQKRKKEEVAALRKKVIEHSKPYKKDEEYAYNTWFGENMPLENDVCALCNVLYLFLDSGLELGEHDLASLDFIAESIEKDKYISQPFTLARHYASTPLIIYHYARLIGSFKIPILEVHKSDLLTQTIKLFEIEKKPMNKLLLHSSMLKLGYRVNYKHKLEELLASKFVPFIGAPFAPFSNALFQKIAAQPCAIIYWECEALKLSYILENEVLRRIYI